MWICVDLRAGLQEKGQDSKKKGRLPNIAMEGFISGNDGEIKGLKDLKASLGDVDDFLNNNNAPSSSHDDDSKSPETTPPSAPLPPAAATITTTTTSSASSSDLSYFKAPTFIPDLISPAVSFRSLCRSSTHTGPTNGKCPGFLQCNLVVLRKEDAFDFLLFCQRNSKSCPIVDVCEVRVGRKRKSLQF